MISCNLQGGLGNQMFQIAATYALAKRNNDTCGFDFERCYTPLQGYKSTKYEKTLFKKINNIKGFNPYIIYNEPKFNYLEIPYHKDLLLNGYFQSELYFKDYQDEIINLFSFDEKIIEELKKYISSINIDNLPTTIIHIRRGDYLLNTNYHPLCSKEYFQKAIDILGDCCYIFISDDIKWVKENFSNKNFFYYDSKDEIYDLTLMTIVDNIIISNSSFSWWGAWLNKTPTKKIIAPIIWFGANGPKESNDIIPKNWMSL
jgi:hypothetical protein